MAEKTLEEHVRELEQKLDAKLDARLKPIKADLVIIKHAVGVILTRLT